MKAQSAEGAPVVWGPECARPGRCAGFSCDLSQAIGYCVKRDDLGIVLRFCGRAVASVAARINQPAPTSINVGKVARLIILLGLNHGPADVARY
jgi:hypothetical protein